MECRRPFRKVPFESRNPAQLAELIVERHPPPMRVDADDLQVDAAFNDRQMAPWVRHCEDTVAETGSHAGAGNLELGGYAD